MKKNLSKASNAHELRTAEGRKILVGGSQLVYASMKPNASVPNGFAEQMPRSASSDVMLKLKRQAPKVYVYLAPALFDVQRKRIALTIDAGLTWGMRQRKGRVALICGVTDGEASGERFEVDVLVFENGTLQSLTSNELPALDSQRFKLSAESLLQSIRTDFPGVRVCLAAPLSNWQVEGLEYLDERVINRANYAPLARTAKSGGNMLIPAGIVAAGAVFACAMIGVKWSAFQTAQNQFQAAFASPEVRAAGGVDSDYIGVMTQRRAFMEAPRRQDVLPAKVLDIVRGIGTLPGVKIRELQLPAPGLSVDTANGGVVQAGGPANNDLITQNRVADARVEVSVPKTDQPALVQARVVLEALSKSTGMSMRLAANGNREDGQNKRRIYIIEGFLHG